jgi:Fe-S cluster biogenesis protein NfuA
VERDAVTAALEEVAVVLRSDGADLVLVDADPKTARIEVTLELRDAHCAECVVPPELLFEMVASALLRQLREEFELVLRDPRSDASHPSAAS